MTHPAVSSASAAPFTERPLWRPADYIALRESSRHPDPASNDDSKRLPAGETIVLADLDGPGMITHIWMTVADNEYGWPRLLRLRVYYDGADLPSVDVPLGDFFASGHGMELEVDSLMVACASQGRARNCYWQMPFRKHCRVTLTNEGAGRAGMVYYQVDWRKYASLPDDALYFHAHYRQESPARMGRYYEILTTEGTGKYVGTVLSVIPNEQEWFGEGDEYFYVDGEEHASVAGTGTEDFLSDAWGLHEHCRPYSGCPSAGGFKTGDRVTAYRWQIADPVPFTKRLKLEIEHAGWTANPDGTTKGSFDERADEFSSVAFWYQTPFRTDLPDLPAGSKRLPYGNALPIQAEDSLDRVTTEAGEASLQKNVFWFQDIILFACEGAGASVTIPFEVPVAGRYEVLPLILKSNDYGVYEVYVDGARTDLHLDLYAPDVTMPRGYTAGRYDMSQGTHTLTFRCVGKAGASAGFRFGIDQIVLARVT